MSARSIRRAQRRELERTERRERRLSAKATLAAGAGATVGATMLFAPAADAATLTVTNLNNAGAGSLRQALIDAEGTAEADTIVFQSGLSGTIELATDLNVRNYSVDIQGPGASQVTIDGPGMSSIFDLYGFAAGQAVSISGLTLTDGSPAVYDGSFGGSAADTTFDAVVIEDGDRGINHANGTADLTILNSTITGNTTDGDGAGIYKASSGALTITDSTISDNETNYEGGGVFVDNSSVAISGSTISGNDSIDNEGGGIYVDDTPGTASTEVTVQDSSFSGNTSDQEGAGVYLDNIDGAAVVERSVFSGNDSIDGDGGGIYLDSQSTAPLTIADSTFSGNTALYDGGAVAIDSGDVALTIENTTMSGNSAEDEGGALYLDGEETSDGDPTVIRNSTIVDNDADSPDDGGGGIFRESYYAGPGDFQGRNVVLSSTIVADNTAPVNPDLGDKEDINDDTEFELGFSLVEDLGNAATSESPAGSNITGVDPELGALAANGGPTQTHLPALASPALDAGIANGLTSDQRGQPRTFDAVVIANASGSDGTDIGATELQPGENDLPGNASCQGAVVGSKTGTEGPDTLTGTDAPDALFGAGGDDALAGLGANDCLNGDAGKDKASGGGGKDLVKGQAGKDKLKGQGGKDKLKGAGGKDKANGGGGKDKVSGGAGKDKVSGGPGKDKLKGNGGSDKLKAADSKRDKVNCGGGNKDKATVDAKDKVSNNCETVKVKG